MGRQLTCASLRCGCAVLREPTVASGLSTLGTGDSNVVDGRVHADWHRVVGRRSRVDTPARGSITLRQHGCKGLSGPWDSADGGDADGHSGDEVEASAEHVIMICGERKLVCW